MVLSNFTCYGIHRLVCNTDLGITLTLKLSHPKMIGSFPSVKILFVHTVLQETFSNNSSFWWWWRKDQYYIMFALWFAMNANWTLTKLIGHVVALGRPIKSTQTNMKNMQSSLISREATQNRVQNAAALSLQFCMSPCHEHDILREFYVITNQARTKQIIDTWLINWYW